MGEVLIFISDASQKLGMREIGGGVWRGGERGSQSNGYLDLVLSGLQQHIVQNNCPYFIQVSRKSNIKN